MNTYNDNCDMKMGGKSLLGATRLLRVLSNYKFELFLITAAAILRCNVHLSAS
jgi:hypothetical protein